MPRQLNLTGARASGRLLRATDSDSDGTCPGPAAAGPAAPRLSPAGQGSDFRLGQKMFPATTLPGGPAQHPSAETLARPGHRPGPIKY